MTDTERLDLLERLEGSALLSDDAGRWAVVCTGCQNVPNPDKPIDIDSTFWVEAKDWTNSVREAIDAVLEVDE